MNNQPRLNMGTSAELEALFAEGRLSEMLAKEFHGEIGRTDVLMKDCEFMMEFENEERAPQADKISEKVIAFYKSHGFEVEVKYGGPNCFLALVHLHRHQTDWNSFVVNITTNYPLAIGEGRNFLRVTCSRL